AGGPARAAGLSLKPGPPRSRYETDYRLLNSPGWHKDFPLLGEDFTVLAPSTPRKGKGAYNCIAHSLRFYDRWVWPGARVRDFDRLYKNHGFRKESRLSYRFQPGVEKLVLYGKVRKDGKLEATHCARQLADGTWTSKLGAGPLIRHTTPYALT